MWLRVIVLGVIISSNLISVYSKPFLFNALVTLASSASASASSSSSTNTSPSAKLTNIVDYTKRQEKVKRLESEKQLAPDEEFNDDQEDKDNNEASPSILQKKINKILAKIQLLSSFSASASSSTTEQDNEETTTTPRSSVKIDFGEVTTIKASKLLQSSSSKEYGLPLKINLEIKNDGNEESTTMEENIETAASSDQSPNRVGQIGVFFVELFGSLVGLAYGAMAHINNAIQGGTEPETRI